MIDSIIIEEMSMAKMRATNFIPAPISEISEPATFDAGPMVNVSGFDVTDLLPVAAAEKLRALRQHADDLHLLIPEFAQLQETTTEKIKVERDLKRLVSPAHDDGFGLPETDARVIAAKRKLGKLTAEVVRQTELRRTRSEAWSAAKITLSNVENWLSFGRPHGTVLEDHNGEPPKLNKGEDVLSALERIRRRGRELRADLHRIRSAPFPSAHARAKIRQEVEILASRGNPVVSGVVENDGKLEFQRVLARAQVHNVPNAPAAVAYMELVDPVALVAWLLKDPIDPGARP